MKKFSKNHISVSKQTYEEVINRDHHRCVMCGANYPLQLHHIMNRQFKHLIDEPTNCVMLCASCHQLVHSNQNKYRELLKGYINELIRIN